MRTVNEVSKLAGVSIRTLQYYDKIGLLHPTGYTESGYRLYDDTALARLQFILLFRELEFPLKEIRQILDAPDFDRRLALEQQIEMLEMKKEHLEKLILHAREIQQKEVKILDFTAFDTRELDAYAKEAKEAWGKSPEYQEFEERQKKWTGSDGKEISKKMMEIFVGFGKLKDLQASDEKAQNKVKELQDYITAHYYTCNLDILRSLGKMYSGDSRFTENIDAAGGQGTAHFVTEAIEIYCDSQKEGAM